LENGAFPEVASAVNAGRNGTERKRAGAREQQSPEIVPKPLVTLGELVAAYRRINERYFLGLDEMEAAQAKIHAGNGPCLYGGE
jgi:hypothetical protein